MNDLDLAYLAGILDGEGCISIVKRSKYYVPIVKIANTNEVLVEHLKKILTTFGVGFCVSKKQRLGNRKAAWEICIESRPRVKKLLGLVIPYLIAKTKQAEIVLESCNYDGRRQVLDVQPAVDQIRNLNFRGLRPEIRVK